MISCVNIVLPDDVILFLTLKFEFPRFRELSLVEIEKMTAKSRKILEESELRTEEEKDFTQEERTKK